MRVSLILALLLGSAGVVRSARAANAPDLRPLVQAVTQKGCAIDPRYHAIAGVLCSGVQTGASEHADPDAVLQTLAESARQQIAALTLQARQEDTACSQEAGTTVAAGTAVGPTNTDELVAGLVHSAEASAAALNPAGLVLAIPGLTQVQYEYKGLSNGPEIRTFKITGHVDGDADQAKLYLQMDGDVDGDKNLYVQYTVNLRTTKSPFPTWSPFLAAPGAIHRSFVRQALDTLSASADFSEQGEHRNGVQPWHEYEYAWHAEKIGARSTDVTRPGTGPIAAVSRYPFGGDWVGSGWGTETRFEQTRQAFVGQFSPALASTMTPEDGSQGVIMSLNVKHQTMFYFHVDFDGQVTGRGVIVYTLDPNLCGVATLTRQVNEQVSFLKYLPIIFAAARQLGDLAVTRFQTAWAQEPATVTAKIDEAIQKLPPKIEPSAGSAEVDAFLAAHPEIKDRLNVAFADVDVSGFPQSRLWRLSGRLNYPDLPEVVPVPTGDSAFKTTSWAQEFKLDESGFDSTQTGRDPYPREFDSERMIMEYLAKNLPPDASGTIRIYSRYPVCPSCTGVIEQFYWRFPQITLLVTSGGG